MPACRWACHCWPGFRGSASACLVAIVGIAFAGGCKREVAPSPAVPTATDAIVEEVSSEEAQTQVDGDNAAPEVQVPSDQPPPESAPAETDGAGDQESGEPADPSGAAPGGVSETEPPPRERVLLLTRDGPLLIDVILIINGAPYYAALEAVVDQALATADTDGDGRASWDETIDNPRFAYGQFGNLTPEDASQRQQLIAMYDNNRNGFVDREELPRFLTRNVGRSRSFSLTSSNEFRGDNRTRSPVRRVLDEDLDGAITEDEMARAPMVLFSRDADDDEILVPADFRDDIEQMQETQLSNQRRINAPDTAILLTDGTKWTYVSYALQETYAYGNRVRADDLPLTPRLVEQVDDNQNGEIDGKEIEKLVVVPPHLVLEVTFDTPDQDHEGKGPRLRLVDSSEELQTAIATARQHPTRISMELPGAEVELFVNEDPGLSNTAELLTNQFKMLDANQNGYLEAAEYPGQVLGLTVPFEGLDADGDGNVYEEEVAALVNQRQAVIRSQIRARAADQEDALFTSLDTTGDGRLTAREIYGAASLLKSLDRNHDGRVQSHEIPGSIAIGFVRGDAQQDNALFVMSAPARQDASESPRWFLGMDSNGDGDISPREFLGPAAQFRQLDTDGDGFLSVAEAAAEVAATSSAGE